MLLKSLVAVAALSVAMPAMAGEWVIGSANGHAVYWVDRSSLRVSNNFRTVWELQAQFADDPDGTAYSLRRVTYDCAAERVKWLSTLFYRADATVISSLDDETEWMSAPPESVLHYLMGTVCGELADNGIVRTTIAEAMESTRQAGSARFQ